MFPRPFTILSFTSCYIFTSATFVVNANWFIQLQTTSLPGLLILITSPKLERKIKEKQVQHFGRGSTNTHMVFCMKFERSFQNAMFFPVLVIVFGNAFRTAGEIFFKTKRGFCQELTHSKKILSVFAQVSWFGRFE